MRKPVVGFEGLYEVDSEGRVYSIVNNSSRRKRQLKPYVNTGGYLRLNLYRLDGKVTKEYVHRIVAKAFIPNTGNKPAVNHIDANKANNMVSNLEWCDAKYNIRESRRMGLQKDLQVRATSLLTGEQIRFTSLKSAAYALSGRTWTFNYYHTKYGTRFVYKNWTIEIGGGVNEVHSA